MQSLPWKLLFSKNSIKSTASRESSKLGFSRFLMLGMYLLAMPASAQNTTEIIVTSGMGSSIESAIQNAARNALTQAVGQFVDTETQISKRTEIRDGVLEITKDMSENISATSNGTIQNIEVLDQVNSDGIFTVDAAVTVRLADLERAMAGSLSLNVEMPNVFSQIAIANQENFGGKVEILSNQFLRPLVSSEFLEVSVGEPQAIIEYLADNDIDELEGGAEGYLSILQNKFNGVIQDVVDLYAREGLTLLVVPVDIGYTDSALESWKSNLEELASDELNFPWNENVRYTDAGYDRLSSVFVTLDESLKEKSKAGDFPICFSNISKGIKCYIISGMSAGALNDEFGAYFSYWIMRKPIGGEVPALPPFESHELMVSLLDEDGYPVAQGFVMQLSNKMDLVRGLSSLRQPNAQFRFGDFPAAAFPMTPSSGLLRTYPSLDPFLPSKTPYINVIEQRRIHVGLILNSEQVQRVRSVEMELSEGRLLTACELLEIQGANGGEVRIGDNTPFFICETER